MKWVANKTNIARKDACCTTIQPKDLHAVWRGCTGLFRLDLCAAGALRSGPPTMLSQSGSVFLRCAQVRVDVVGCQLREEARRVPGVRPRVQQVELFSSIGRAAHVAAGYTTLRDDVSGAPHTRPRSLRCGPLAVSVSSGRLHGEPATAQKVMEEQCPGR